MKTKTFVAPTMNAAMQQVKQELGMEAIIISVRQVPLGPAWKIWQAPGVEVVAMQTHSEPVKTNPEPAAKESLRADDKKSTVKKPKPAAANSTAGSKTKQQAFQAALNRSMKEEADITDDSEPNDLLNDLKPVLDSGATTSNPPPAKQNQVKTFIPKSESKNKPAASGQTGTNGGNTAKPGSSKSVTPKQISEMMTIPWPLVNAQRQLLKQGVDKEIVHKVINVCAETLNAKALENEALVQEYLCRQLEAHLRIHTGATLAMHRLICLVGPSGAGKSSLSAKLTARATSARNRKVAWICADTVRAGAIAEAQVYADTLGVSLHLAYTPEELLEAANSEKDASAVVVDTSACNPYNEDNMIELGATLQALPNRVTYLVAPATAKEVDLIQLMASIGIFKLDGLVLTKLDETRSYGAVFNLAWHSQLPLAYFTSGTHIVEDIRAADGRVLTRALFGLETF